MSYASVIAALDAAIEEMALGGGAKTLTVAGRSVTFSTLDELIRARAAYAALDASQQGRAPFGMFHTSPQGVN